MLRENLISASLSDEDLAGIQQNIEAIRSRLDFLLSLEPAEVQSLFKVGTVYVPFLEKASNAAAQHPQILPAVFDAEEFRRDHALARNLSLITTQIRQLESALENTLAAAHNDTMKGALEIYAAVQQNRDKVPGLKVIAEEMAAFFKKPRRKDT